MHNVVILHEKLNYVKRPSNAAFIPYDAAVGPRNDCVNIDDATDRKQLFRSPLARWIIAKVGATHHRKIIAQSLTACSFFTDQRN